MSLNGLSLFANVGIAEAYLKEVGVNIVLANELLDERAKFYSNVYPECNMIQGDIVDDEIRNRIVKLAIEKNVKFIIATPPCQGMSLAGNKDPNDSRNFLITYAVDVIKKVNPDYVLIENVTQVLTTYVSYNNEKVLIPEMLNKELGMEYRFNVNHIMSTEKLGVPQKRVRAVFLLTKKSLNKKWEIPKWDGSIVTVRDAIGDLPSLDPLIKEPEYRYIFPDYEKKKKEGLKVSKWHYPRYHVWRNVEVMMHTPEGCSAKKNPIFYPKNKDGKMAGGSGSAYMRMSWDKPAPTITTYNHTISSFQNVHPGRYDAEHDLWSDARVLTIFELMRIMSLPDDWNIPDWASERLIRQVIGEGIPPLAIKKIVQELHLEVSND